MRWSYQLSSSHGRWEPELGGDALLSAALKWLAGYLRPSKHHALPLYRWLFSAHVSEAQPPVAEFLCLNVPVSGQRGTESYVRQGDRKKRPVNPSLALRYDQPQLLGNGRRDKAKGLG